MVGIGGIAGADRAGKTFRGSDQVISEVSRLFSCLQGNWRMSDSKRASLTIEMTSKIVQLILTGTAEDKAVTLDMLKRWPQPEKERAQRNILSNVVSSEEAFNLVRKEKGMRPCKKIKGGTFTEDILTALEFVSGLNVQRIVFVDNLQRSFTYLDESSRSDDLRQRILEFRERHGITARSLLMSACKNREEETQIYRDHIESLYERCLISEDEMAELKIVSENYPVKPPVDSNASNIHQAKQAITAQERLGSAVRNPIAWEQLYQDPDGPRAGDYQGFFDQLLQDGLDIKAIEACLGDYSKLPDKDIAARRVLSIVLDRPNPDRSWVVSLCDRCLWDGMTKDGLSADQYQTLLELALMKPQDPFLERVLASRRDDKTPIVNGVLAKVLNSSSPDIGAIRRLVEHCELSSLNINQYQKLLELALMKPQDPFLERILASRRDDKTQIVNVALAEVLNSSSPDIEAIRRLIDHCELSADQYQTLLELVLRKPQDPLLERVLDSGRDDKTQIANVVLAKVLNSSSPDIGAIRRLVEHCELSSLNANQYQKLLELALRKPQDPLLEQVLSIEHQYRETTCRNILMIDVKGATAKLSPEQRQVLRGRCSKPEDLNLELCSKAHPSRLLALMKEFGWGTLEQAPEAHRQGLAELLVQNYNVYSQRRDLIEQAIPHLGAAQEVYIKLIGFVWNQYSTAFDKKGSEEEANQGRGLLTSILRQAQKHGIEEDLALEVAERDLLLGDLCMKIVEDFKQETLGSL